MNYLWSFFSSSSPANPTHALSDELKGSKVDPSRALHAEWLEQQARHTKETRNLLAKLIEDNAELQKRLDSATTELEVSVLRSKDSMNFAVVILDFETDVFSPQILSLEDAGSTACQALKRKMLDLLAPITQEGVEVMIYLFYSPRSTVIERLIDTGVVRSRQEIDSFIQSFNAILPLSIVVIDDSTPEKVRQRQRALAATYARASSCQLVLLGRWAFELELAEMLAPSSTKAVYPAHVRFVEPVIGFYIPPALKRRLPRIVTMTGIHRKRNLPKVSVNSLELDPRKALSQQTPQICLDFYLDRCLHEECPFSHAYRIPPHVVRSLRYDLSRMTCPLVVAGLVCLDPGQCHFAHETKLASSPAFPKSGRIPLVQHGLSRIQHLPDRPPVGASPPLQPLRQSLVSVSKPRPPSRSPALSIPARHPLSPPIPVVLGSKHADSLTDEQLRSLLEKSRKEEEEYERDLREDPFFRAP